MSCNRLFLIGSYKFCAKPSRNYYALALAYKRNKNIWKNVRDISHNENCDYLLHQTLSKIFGSEHSLRRWMIKHTSVWTVSRLLHTNKNSIINLIIEKNFAVSRFFSKEELEKLSVLWIAILSDYENSAELLVRTGADVKQLFGRHKPQIIDEKWTVLHVLLQMDPSLENERLIRLVTIRGANLQAQDSMGRTVMHIAVSKSRVEIIEMFLEKGADVNIADNNGVTPLLKAASSRKADELVPLLVKYGADVNVADNKGITPLFEVTSRRKADKLLPLLVKHGANVNVADNNGITPLFKATRRRVADKLVPLLLKHGADVNAADKDGLTPLLITAIGRKADKLIPLLVKYGADIFAKDKSGHNALHYLSLAPVEYIDIAKFFIEKGVSIHDRHNSKEYQPIHIAACCNAKNELVKLYLDHGADVNSQAQYGMVPLYLTLLLPQDCNTVPLLQTLLERGANVNYKTTVYGRTALHEACLLVDDEKIRILLSAGADMLIYDDNHEEEPRMPLDELYRLCKKVKNPSVRLMVKTLALRRVYRPSSINLTDETICKKWPKYWNFFQDCVKKLEESKIARLSKNCTFFELLTKCHCQITVFMRNPEFEINFKNYDLTEFSMYAEDMNEAFERVKKHYDSVLEQEDVIAEAVYDILPHMIVRKMTHYILDCVNEKHRKNILGIE